MKFPPKEIVELKFAMVRLVLIVDEMNGFTQEVNDVAQPMGVKSSQ